MQARGRKPRVLVAVSERAAERMCRILDGLELEQPGSLALFAQALRCSSFDLVVIGCHFDGSHAIEAVKTARWHAPRVPLACVLAAPFSSRLGEAALSVFHVAAEELGADCFIDLMQFPDDAEGNARARAMLQQCVA
jgi:hypothetical protein